MTVVPFPGVASQVIVPPRTVTAARMTESPTPEAMAASTQAIEQASGAPASGQKIQVTGNQEISGTTIALAEKFRMQVEHAGIAEKFTRDDYQSAGSNAWLKDRLK